MYDMPMPELPLAFYLLAVTIISGALVCLSALSLLALFLWGKGTVISKSVLAGSMLTLFISFFLGEYLNTGRFPEFLLTTFVIWAPLPVLAGLSIGWVIYQKMKP
jgi:hypothetical protein